VEPFPKFTGDAVDDALSLRLLVLLEREPELVAEQVRAWLAEDES
jgi:hypothetical protein